MRYIHIRNWDRFQHPDVTRGRSTAAPWIKDYTAQEDDDDYRALTLAERGLLHCLRRAYARRKCLGIPQESRTIASIVGQKVSTKQIERLNHAGFIVFSASKLQADFQENSTLDVDVDKETPFMSPLEEPGPRTEVVAVFEHWQRARAKPRCRLTRDRERKIRARLREYSTAELMLAVDGVANDPWQDRSSHDDIGVVFRNAQQVDKFLALASVPNGSHGDDIERSRQIVARMAQA